MRDVLFRSVIMQRVQSDLHKLKKKKKCCTILHIFTAQVVTFQVTETGAGESIIEHKNTILYKTTRD